MDFDYTIRPFITQSVHLEPLGRQDVTGALAVHSLLEGGAGRQSRALQPGGILVDLDGHNVDLLQVPPLPFSSCPALDPEFGQSSGVFLSSMRADHR